MSGTEPSTLSPEAPPPDGAHCPGCGYDLRAATWARCPECGYALDGLRSPRSGIPWLERHKRGHLRTFWATVALVRFRNPQFCEEYVRDVDYTHAQRFRAAVIAHVLVALLGGLIVAYPVALTLLGPRDGWNPPWFDQALREGWPVGVLLLCTLLYLLAATGVPSYFFHPPALPVARQNSAVAMSYYAAGPLALMVVPVFTGLIFMALAIEGVLAGEIGWPIYAAGTITALGAVGVFAVSWMALVDTARRIMPQLRRRWISMAIAVPLLWLALAVLILIALPLVVLWLAIVLASLA